jgi:thiosulfate/3-mercaptopyruvate sulfurtransferase
MYNTLITVDDLAVHRSFVVVDCRHSLQDFSVGLAAYHEAHIPDAHFLHMEDDLSGPKTGTNGRHPLPDPQMLAAKLGAIGIDGGTQIVAYDQGNGMFASRLWWLARWLGHEAVAVLDGGVDAWTKAGRQLSTVAPTAVPAHFPIRPALEAQVNADQVLDAHWLLLDARTADRFRGQNETIDPVAGRIPGALNRPYTLNVSDGHFKTAMQLRDEFTALLEGRDPKEVVHYCGSGVSAAHNRLAMEIAGLPGSRIYPGSWSEWIADPLHPVTSGH